MISTKTAVKRKIHDDEPDELEKCSKIRKVEKIQKANKELQSTNKADSLVVFQAEENMNTAKIRKRLSSILHFQKKYKYYCKKHNVIYLIEKTRRSSRELSKKSRDNLVNNFRSLDLTKNVSVNAHLGNLQQFLPSMEVEFEDDDSTFNQPTSDSVTTECKISRIFVTCDEYETDNYRTQCKENRSSNHQSANKLSLSQLIHSFLFSDESEDNDSDEGYTEEYYQPSKHENFTLTRSPGGTTIIMKKIDDSSDVSYYEDCCTHHNCTLNHCYNNNSYDYDSSFSED